MEERGKAKRLHGGVIRDLSVSCVRNLEARGISLNRVLGTPFPH